MLADWSSTNPERAKESEKRIAENPENADLFVAEIDGELVGFGEIVAGNNELRAVYVSPTAGRKGVGKALLAKLEATARERGVEQLWLHSSLSAEAFYIANGYIDDGKGSHTLRSGKQMACIKMHKKL